MENPWEDDDFDHDVRELVNDSAPRLFAVVQVYGKQEDGRIAAWGMAFDDHAEIVGVDNGTRLSLRSPERATRWFTRAPEISARLAWVGRRPPGRAPSAQTHPDRA